MPQLDICNRLLQERYHDDGVKLPDRITLGSCCFAARQATMPGRMQKMILQSAAVTRRVVKRGLSNAAVGLALLQGHNAHRVLDVFQNSPPDKLVVFRARCAVHQSQGPLICGWKELPSVKQPTRPAETPGLPSPRCDGRFVPVSSTLPCGARSSGSEYQLTTLKSAFPSGVCGFSLEWHTHKRGISTCVFGSSREFLCAPKVA